MTVHEEKRRKIIVDRKKEMRTIETSRMIDESGLGNRTHYEIVKVSSPEKELQEIEKEKDKSLEIGWD